MDANIRDRITAVASLGKLDSPLGTFSTLMRWRYCLFQFLVKNLHHVHRFGVRGLRIFVRELVHALEVLLDGFLPAFV